MPSKSGWWLDELPVPTSPDREESMKTERSLQADSRPVAPPRRAPGVRASVARRSPHRLRPGLVASALAVVFACEPAPAPPPPPPPLAGVVEVLLALPEAWNARDASAWVAHFDPESGFTNILGMHFPDREANQARHAALFESIFANSRLSAEVLSVRRVGDRGAVAEVALTLVGYDRLPPGVEETEPGVLHTRLITVLEHREEGWTVVAAQNTAILPGT